MERPCKWLWGKGKIFVNGWGTTDTRVMTAMRRYARFGSGGTDSGQRSTTAAFGFILDACQEHTK